jgi:V/A-type H+-transporting ATPase subunit D
VGKIKLTKNELKRQKDALKRFLRYLPTLMLKKQQLQMEIRKVETQVQEGRLRRERSYEQLTRWIAVFGEQQAQAGGISLESTLRIGEVRTETGNIAGVDIPLFESIQFGEEPYDLFATPLWVDAAIDKVKELAALDAEMHVLQQQADLLGEELRVTSQRVNLFEKVKIPEARDNIRRVQIYLGDEQTASVVRGKIAKKKLVRVTG